MPPSIEYMASKMNLIFHHQLIESCVWILPYRLRIFFFKGIFFHYILYELSWKFIDGSQKSSCHVITYFRSQWTICYAVKSFLWLKFGDKTQVNQYFWNISKWQRGSCIKSCITFPFRKEIIKKMKWHHFPKLKDFYIF